MQITGLPTHFSKTFQPPAASNPALSRARKAHAEQADKQLDIVRKLTVNPSAVPSSRKFKAWFRADGNGYSWGAMYGRKQVFPEPQQNAQGETEYGASKDLTELEKHLETYRDAVKAGQADGRLSAILAENVQEAAG